MVVVDVVICDECVDLTHLEKGSGVMIPYMCMRATVRSSLRLMGIGRLCVITSLSSCGVRLTLNCVFIPMSSLWRKKMSSNSTIVGSRRSRSFPVISESVHLIIVRNLVRDSSLSVGSSFSSLASSRSSLKIRFCKGECSCSFPGFSGVGNQNFPALFPGRSTCIKALMYVTTSSCSVKRLIAARPTGRIIFVFSGFKTCNSATLVSAAVMYGKSVVLAIFIAALLSLAIVIAGATTSFAHSSNCGRG